MNPGEYKSKTGVNRWTWDSYGYELRNCNGDRCELDPEDWPAAKKALDELIEENRIDWLTFPMREGRSRLYIDPRGIVYKVQWAEGEHCVPINECGDSEAKSIIGAYRKGREVALKEAQELVKLIGSLAGSYRWGEPLGTLFRMQKLDWDNIVDKARRLRA